MSKTATAELLDLHRVAGYLGAQISGIDLASPLNDLAIGALREALLVHKVLFFRDQNLDHARHVALGQRFGTLQTLSVLDEIRQGCDHSPHPSRLILEPHQFYGSGVAFRVRWRRGVLNTVEKLRQAPRGHEPAMSASRTAGISSPSSSSSINTG